VNNITTMTIRGIKDLWSFQLLTAAKLIPLGATLEEIERMVNLPVEPCPPGPRWLGFLWSRSQHQWDQPRVLEGFKCDRCKKCGMIVLDFYV
jgi:hypothetical protein